LSPGWTPKRILSFKIQFADFNRGQFHRWNRSRPCDRDPVVPAHHDVDIVARSLFVCRVRISGPSIVVRQVCVGVNQHGVCTRIRRPEHESVRGRRRRLSTPEMRLARDRSRRIAPQLHGSKTG
jgi:hypothetical protein